MRILAMAGAVLTICAATAVADELKVADATLETMGLARMQQLSDAEGLQVRGKGLLDDFLGPALGAVDASINEGLIGAGAGDLFPNGLDISGTILGELPDFDLPGLGGGGGGGGGMGGLPGFPTGPGGGGFPGGGLGGGFPGFGSFGGMMGM